MSDLTITLDAYKTMPTEAIEAMKPFAKDNPSLMSLLEAILASRKAEVEATQKAAAFGKAIETITGKLPQPPAEVHNFYAHYGEVEAYDTSKPKEEVVVMVDGKEAREMRHPLVKTRKWIVVTNHVCHVNGKGAASTSPGESGKRAITVKRVVNDQIQLVGNFRNAKEACDHLKIEVAGDSAPRKLLANGYITTAYIGNGYLIKS